MLLEQVPRDARRVLDLGNGEGRLLALLQRDRREMLGVGLDFSALMLAEGRKRFADEERIELVEHDLAELLLEVARDGASDRGQAAPAVIRVATLLSPPLDHAGAPMTGRTASAAAHTCGVYEWASTRLSRARPIPLSSL